MIERCAKAIFTKRYQAPGTYQNLEWERFSNKELYYEDVRQCIKAMREPTEKMIAAGKNNYQHGSAIAYQAMIDAVINE